MKKSLIIRNLKLYYRDQTAVFFSLLSSIIIIVLYVLFLAQMQIDSISQGITQNVSTGDIAYLVHTWLLAGLLSVTSLTSVLAGYGTMITDWEYHIMKDFRSSPIPSWKYPVSICISSFLIGVITCVITFVIYYFIIVMICGYWITLVTISKCLALIILSSLFSASLMGVVCIAIRTSRSYSSISLVIGTFIGFVNGLYVPLGSLSQSITNTIVSFPFIHVASLFRKILTEDSYSVVFKGATDSINNHYSDYFGITLNLFDYEVSSQLSVVYVVFVIIISLLAMVYLWKIKSKKI